MITGGSNDADDEVRVFGGRVALFRRRFGLGVHRRAASLERQNGFVPPPKRRVAAKVNPRAVIFCFGPVGIDARGSS